MSLGNIPSSVRMNCGKLPDKSWPRFKLETVDKTELGGHRVWAAGVQAPLCKMKFLLTERTRTAWTELHVEVVLFPESLFHACYCRMCQLWRLYSIAEASSCLLLMVYWVWWGDVAGTPIDKVLLHSWIQTNAVTERTCHCWTKTQS